MATETSYEKLFNNVKNAYAELRELERQKLAGALSGKGYIVVKGGSAGKGRPDYTNHGTINQYDLSNWKWVACSKEGFHYTISFQTFDKDVKSLNCHALFDRIGVYKYVWSSLEDMKKNYEQATDIINKKENPEYEDLIKYDIKKKYNPDDAFYTMENANIDLPLDDKKIQKLIEFMENLYYQNTTSNL